MRPSSAPIISADAVQARVRDLGHEITCFYAGAPVVLVVVLKGGLLFAADLMRHIELPLRIECVHARSYAGTQSTGDVAMYYPSSIEITGEHVLLVEDILDTGLTARRILDDLASKNPASFRVCTLLDKPGNRKVALMADFTGFELANRFVVGYGLDYDEQYRGLPALHALEEDREHPEQ